MAYGLLYFKLYIVTTSYHSPFLRVVLHFLFLLLVGVFLVIVFFVNPLPVHVVFDEMSSASTTFRFNSLVVLVVVYCCVFGTVAAAVVDDTTQATADSR